jgi:hypothetical protein
MEYMKLIQNGRQTVLAVSTLAACVVSVAAASAALAGGQSALAPQWRVVARTPGFLDAIIAPAARDAWAFGWIPRRNGLIAPVARHWNGRRWTSVTMPPGVGDSGMACAGASSPANVWAFSGAGASLGNPPASAAALRLQHGRWVVQHSFPGSYVTGCNVFSPANVWVFGGQLAGLGPGVGTWHLTRSGWTMVKTGNLVLFNASAVSANDVWATGAAVTNHGMRITPVVARWNGRAWVPDKSITAALPTPSSHTGVGLEAINALSAKDVWVQGFLTRDGTISGVVVVHWNGQRWHRVTPARRGYHLPNAVPDGHGGWWAPPFIQNPSAPYLLHEANGRWTRFPLPTRGGFNLLSFSLANVPHTASMLAAGNSSQGGVILAFGRLPR